MMEEKIKRHIFSNSPLEIIACLQLITSNMAYTPMGGMINGAKIGKAGMAIPESLMILQNCIMPCLEKRLARDYDGEVCQHILEYEFKSAVADAIYQIKKHNHLLKDITFEFDKESNGIKIKM